MNPIRILLSPTKRMIEDNEGLPYKNLPQFLKKTDVLVDYLQSLSYEELKRMWKCSDNLATLNEKRIQRMDLTRNLTPAILSFQGLQYQHIGAQVFTYDELDYIEEHLRILSGFYGVLKPFDGVVPYRLEMQAKFSNWAYDSLVEFWGEALAQTIGSETDKILNLASKEYSEPVTQYLDETTKVVTCVFGEWMDGKVKQKGTLVKMARGEMINFMAEHQIKSFEDIKKFNSLNYSYRDDLSDEKTYIFLKKEK